MDRQRGAEISGIISTLFCRPLHMCSNLLRYARRFNRTFFLTNVHAINVPLCFLDHFLQPRKMVLWDLWAGMLFGVSYLFFCELSCLYGHSRHLN